MHDEATMASRTGHEATQQYLAKLEQAIDRLSQVLQHQPAQTLSAGGPASRNGLSVASAGLQVVSTFNEASAAVQMATIQEETPDLRVLRETLGVARSLVDAISARGSVVGQTDSGGPTRPGSKREVSYTEPNGNGAEALDAPHRADSDLSSESETIFMTARSNTTSREDLRSLQEYPVGRCHRVERSHRRSCISSLDVEDSFYDADLMTDLLDNYISTGMDDLLNHRYKEAKFNLLEAISEGERRENVYNFPLDDKLQVEISLATAQIGLEEFDSAERRLKSLLKPTAEGRMDRGNVLHLLAKLHHQKYSRYRNAALLPRAEQVAMNFYNFSSHFGGNAQTPFLLQSADILVQVYDWMGKSVAAGTIRSRHPRIISPTTPTRTHESPLESPGSVSDSATDVDNQPSEAWAPSTVPSTRSRGRTASEISGPQSTTATSLPPDATANLTTKVQEGDVFVVKLLLQLGENIEKIDETSGLTPLLTAAKYKQTEVCRALLTNHPAKADVNAKCKDGRGVLHFALFGSGGDDMIPLLLNHNADPNAVDKLDRTPLHYCVEHNKPLAMRHLLAKNVDKEVTNKAHETALQCAIRKKNSILAKILYNAGAVVDTANIHKMSPDIKWILQQPRDPNANLGIGLAVSRQNSAATTQTTKTTRSARSALSRLRRLGS